jgi:hypothetical protein
MILSRVLLFILCFGAMVWQGLAFINATQASPGTHHHKEVPSHDDDNSTINLELVPSRPLQKGETVSITARLIGASDKRPVTFDDLKEAHTRKLHLLIIDESLADYHHVHPIENTGKPGEIFWG